MKTDRLSRLAFRCPRCGSGDLSLTSHSLRCAGCASEFRREGDRIDFGAPDDHAVEDPLDRFKRIIKRYPRIYRFLQWLISPLYFDGTERRFIRDHVRRNTGVCLNLGSGNMVLDPALINVDATAYPGVDLVSDVAALPLQDSSADVVMNISVLEHLPDPERVVAEIHRVLKPGGLIYTDIPFVVGYHASPADYTRWTDEGVRHLHRRFEELRLVNNGGPTSALLWIAQEWIALVLSFGSRRLHTAIYVVVMALTFPLKFLDVALKYLPTSRQISSCFIYIGRKPAGR